MLVLREKAVSGIMLTLLFIGMLTIAFNIQPVKANGTIYIRADGSIDPPTASISTVDNVTYTFADNIYTDSIVIEKDDIVIDGNYYMLNGSGGGIRGFDISYRNNVTVKNVKIIKFSDGIYVYRSNDSKILDNTVTDCWYAIEVMHSSNNNMVIGNTVNNSYGGISVDYSSNDNTVTNNTVIDSKYLGWGLYLWASSGNVFSDNMATNNSKGMDIRDAVNNTIHHNKISGNQYGVYLSYSSNNIISQNNITANSYDGVYLYFSSNNNISGNSIEANNHYGIWLDYSSFNSISGSNIANNWDGILFGYSSDNSVSGNNITANDEAGIWLSYSSNHNTIYGNEIVANDQYGIWLYDSSDNRILGNNVTNSSRGMYLTRCSNNLISGNTMTNSTYQGIELYEISSNNSIFENVLMNNEKGIWIHHYSDYNTISKNTIVNNDYGIMLSECSTCNIIDGNNVTANSWDGISLSSFSNGNSVSGNNITANNWNGIYICCSSDNDLSENNIIENNRRDGIDVEFSSGNRMSGNNIANNGIGIWIHASSNNSIYHNNLNNTEQVESYDSRNFWDDGYPSGGNYWSDYDGSDLYLGPSQDEPGGDGIGDTLYVIDESNSDNYPLMNPWLPPDLATVSITASKNVVGEGCVLNVTVIVANLGNKVENLNTTVYANETIITYPQVFLLKSGNSLIYTFTWDTTGFVKGNYTIWAYVEPIEGETNTTNNRFIYGTLVVTIPGDVDGNYEVDIFDITAICICYDSKIGDPNYHPNYDIDGNDIIDIFDVTTACITYGQKYP